MSLPIDQKKLEKRYKNACKRRFGISIEEIDKISNMFEGYLMIEYKNQLYLISDRCIPSAKSELIRVKL